MSMQIAVEIEGDVEVAPPDACCTNCGSGSIHPAQVRSAFWHQDRLVVVEDIPALVCDDCHEQFFDDATIVRLDLLRGTGFPPDAAQGTIAVPVFSLRGQAAD